MKHFKSTLFIMIVLFLLVACGGETAVPPEENTEATQAPVVETVIVVATATAEPAPDSSGDETAVSADTPVLEAAPVDQSTPYVTTLIDLNVRMGPGTNYPVVGVLKQGQNANIMGKSPNGNWWKIQCPAGVGSECWTSAGAQYSTASNANGVAVAAVPNPPATYTPTASPTSDATYTPTPTTDPNSTPTITPTNDPNATATYTPTATKEGDPTYTPTPTATTTQTKIADFDNDSLQNPAHSIFFSPTGNKTFTHSNAVSYANGDQDDWVEFEFPNNSNSSQSVWITLSCTIMGNPEAQLRATVYENGSASNQSVSCNQGEMQLTVDNNKTQQVRIYWNITKDDIYADYVLTVVGYK